MKIDSLFEESNRTIALNRRKEILADMTTKLAAMGYKCKTHYASNYVVNGRHPDGREVRVTAKANNVIRFSATEKTVNKIVTVAQDQADAGLQLVLAKLDKGLEKYSVKLNKRVGFDLASKPLGTIIKQYDTLALNSPEAIDVLAQLGSNSTTGRTIQEMAETGDVRWINMTDVRFTSSKPIIDYYAKRSDQMNPIGTVWSFKIHGMSKGRKVTVDQTVDNSTHYALIYTNLSVDDFFTTPLMNYSKIANIDTLCWMAENKMELSESPVWTPNTTAAGSAVHARNRTLRVALEHIDEFANKLANGMTVPQGIEFLRITGTSKDEDHVPLLGALSYLHQYPIEVTIPTYAKTSFGDTFKVNSADDLLRMQEILIDKGWDQYANF